LEAVTDLRECAQCGTVFVPPREHARFCSAACRVAWNEDNATAPTGGKTLEWAVVAQQAAIDRLLAATAREPQHAFTVISEAVWWTTIVDANLVRYHPDAYRKLLTSHTAAEQQAIELTLGGLRFVRNQMGYGLGHDDLISHPDQPPSSPEAIIATWTWRPVRDAALADLPESTRDWEKSRHHAYQAQLAHRPIGTAFTQATPFLHGVCAAGLLAGP
jgi:hypothetical protein